MVHLANWSCGRDSIDSLNQIDDHNHIPRRKRLKVSAFNYDLSSPSCDGDFGCASLPETAETGRGCEKSLLTSSSCGGCCEEVGSHTASEMSCHSNGNSDNAPQLCNGGSSSSSLHEQSYPGYASASFVSGWMYINQNGEMCGPYIQEQLYEGLSTGFLPADLHVYPIVNGTISGSVPLKYFEQFPDHVATGFAYMTGVISGVTAPTNIPGESNNPLLTASTSSSSAALPGIHSKINDTHCFPQQVPNSGAIASNLSFQDLSTSESSLFFVDSEGRKHGPHSLMELYSWHHYGYLSDSTMVRSKTDK